MGENKILIMEDDERNRKCLEALVRKVDKDSRIYSMADVSEAYRIAMDVTIDLFLIDIMLNKERRNDVSGIKFAEKMRSIKRYALTPMIFITALMDYNMRAFRHTRYFSYLEKPYSKEEAISLITKALACPKINEDDKCIYFRKDGVVYSYLAKDIVFVENRNHKITIFTSKKEMSSFPYKTCKEVLEDLDSPRFVQCSRNTIINKNYIKYIDPRNMYIKLEGYDPNVEIGSVYKNYFKKTLGI